MSYVFFQPKHIVGKTLGKLPGTEQRIPRMHRATANSKQQTANKHKGSRKELPEACRHDVAHTARTTRSSRKTKRMAAAAMKKEPSLLLLLLGFSSNEKSGNSHRAASASEGVSTCPR